MRILTLYCKSVVLSLSLILFICIGVSSGIVEAADCAAVSKSIQREMNLLKKRKLLQESIQQCASDPIINYHYAYTLERLRKYEEALKYYIKASEMDDQKSDYFFGMADIYMVLGNGQSAIWAYEKGLAINGKNKRAQKKLAIVRIKYKSQLGDVVTSEEIVQVMQEEEPGHSTGQSLEGPILRMLIPYERGSSSLSDEAKVLVDIVGRALQDEKLQGARFEVIGHTDSSGTEQSNMWFSKHRAETVRDYLIEQHQVAPDRLSIAYYGERRPIMPNTIEANRAVNRRVEFRRIMSRQ